MWRGSSVLLYRSTSPADEGPALPTKQNEEFRPFIRRLPEFKFWWVQLTFPVSEHLIHRFSLVGLDIHHPDTTNEDLSSDCCPDQDSFSLQALSDKGHRHRHGLHIFWSLQCASVLANTCNVLHHALLHHNEEADQGKHSPDIPAAAAWKIRSAEAFF